MTTTTSPRLARRAAVRAGALATGTAGAILLTATVAGASMSAQLTSSGGSDELVPPPALSCDDVVFVTESSFDSAGNPIGSPRFGSTPDLVSSHDIPFATGPVLAVLDQVITYDGHGDRDQQVGQWGQPAEQVRFEFVLGGVVQGSTALTPDIADGQRSAWVVSDLGSVTLENGADTLRIVHSGDTSSPNSLVVSGVCGSLEDIPVVETTEPELVVAPPSTPAPTVAPPVVEPPEQVVETTTTAPPAIETEVLPAVETAEPALALTGAEDAWLAALGASLIAAGAAAMAASRRLREA